MLRPETPSKALCTPTKGVSPGLEEFGLGQEDHHSAARESPSRRKRLLGSIRSMSSLRSLRSTHSSNNPYDGSLSKVESSHTPSREVPSLALNFEVSPPDKPMFDTSRKLSEPVDLPVQRSSPITVPASACEAASTCNASPKVLSFSVGTVPDSPAPLQRPSVQHAILTHAAATVPKASPESIEPTPFADPLPTPMPGTSFPLEDGTAPENVVSSHPIDFIPSNIQQDYFDLNAVKGENGSERTDSMYTTDELDPDDDAEIVAMMVRVADDYTEQPPEPISGKSEPIHSHDARSVLSNDNSTIGATEMPLSIDGIGDNLTNAVWDDPVIADEDKCQSERRKSSWGRHTGLYDGTGYGRSTDKTGSRISRASTSFHTDGATDGTDLTIPEEEAPRTKKKYRLARRSKSSAQLGSQSSEDSKEELQAIIRAYASYRGEDTEEQDIGSIGGWGGQADLPGNADDEDVKADVELSIRVMNRSLGG